MTRKTIVSTPRYSVAVDPSRRHLEITSAGLWSSEDAGAFGTALTSAIATLQRAGVRSGTIRTSVDVRNASIMPQSITEWLQGYARDYGPSSERIAIICGNMLQKLQYRRIAPQAMFGHFNDADEALAWLFAKSA